MKKNDCLRLCAENLGADLEGVCHADGFTVFVPGLLPGEECSVRITKVEKRFAFGKMEAAVLAPSPTRRDVDCAAFPQCGGCSCRHIRYEDTLKAKQQQVKDCFLRIGKIDCTVPSVLGMDHPFAYRNKTALPVGGVVGHPVMGFYAPRSHRIIPIDECPNAAKPASAIEAAVREWMLACHISPYSEEQHSGCLRHIIVRVNRRGEAMLILVVNQRKVNGLEKLLPFLKALGVISFYLNFNFTQTNVILSDQFQLLDGVPSLREELCGLQFDLSPDSFFQVNPLQTEKLYQTALDFAALKETDHLCDVYCGAGTITLFMAQHCRHATGIEIVPAAIERAKANARLNHISNCDFYAGQAEKLLPAFVHDHFRPDVIVVDPPRKGLEAEVIDAIAIARPSRLVYVSCNVATQARDAALLAEKGYSLRKVQPVDMFCWTSGVENVALFEPDLSDS